jgi:acylphosphatase
MASKKSQTKKPQKAPARKPAPAVKAKKNEPAPPPPAPPPPPPKPEPPRDPNAKELRHIRIHGKVQGVGYRFFATRVARRLGLKGSIQNQRDGSVEAIVEGTRAVIDQWLEELREGPRYAEVTQIDQETKEFTGRLGDFDVRF